LKVAQAKSASNTGKPGFRGVGVGSRSEKAEVGEGEIQAWAKGREAERP
jgi:hypothetical protein